MRVKKEDIYKGGALNVLASHACPRNEATTIKSIGFQHACPRMELKPIKLATTLKPKICHQSRALSSEI